MTDAETILVKFGTAIITHENRLNRIWLKSKVKEITALMRKRKKIILISSGSVAAGMEEEGLKGPARDAFHMQILSGIGQPLLFKIYKDLFGRHGYSAAQILLTHHNFQTPRERLNIQRLINHYLTHKTVPIINTNDIITSEELMRKAAIKFSDNDQLAALVAANLNVDLLMLITHVEGLYPENPKSGGNKKILELVPKVTRSVELMASKGKSPLGSGGMLSKVRAARDVTRFGIPAVIAHGKYSLQDILTHKAPRTLFSA